MDLQKKLLSLEEYKIGFNVCEGKFLININFPKGWVVIKPINENIQYYSDSNTEGKYYYIAPVSISIEEIFSEIDNTISYNTELENKILLFKQKMAELQQLFVDTSLDTLKTLEFKMKIKRKPKKKCKEDKNEEIIEDNTINKDNDDGNNNIC